MQIGLVYLFSFFLQIFSVSHTQPFDRSFLSSLLSVMCLNECFVAYLLPNMNRNHYFKDSLSTFFIEKNTQRDRIDSFKYIFAACSVHKQLLLWNYSNQMAVSMFRYAVNGIELQPSVKT